MIFTVKPLRSLRYQTIRFFQVFLWVTSKIVVSLSKTQIHHQSTIEKTHSAMVVSNHTSLRDSLFFTGSLSWQQFRSLPPLRAITAKWYFHSPLFPILFLIGCYPARPLMRVLKPYAGVAAATRFMQQGYSIGIYPEGRRVRKKRIPARGGIIRMLQGYTPDALYLCRIQHTDNNVFIITTTRRDEVAKITDANKIMDEIYALEA